MSQMDIAWALREAALDLAAVRRAVRHTSGVAMNDTLQQRARGMAKQFDGGDEDDVRGEFIRELADRLDALEAALQQAATALESGSVGARKLEMALQTATAELSQAKADIANLRAALAEAQAENARLHYLRPEVQAFARLMEDGLRRHDKKRGLRGWQGESQTWLFERLLDEVRELKYAGDKIGSEAADVANFAMMIADVAGALAGGPR